MRTRQREHLRRQGGHMKRQEGYMRRREGHMAPQRVKVAMVAAVTGAAMAAATAFAVSSGTAHGKTALASEAQSAQAASRGAGPTAPLRVLSISLDMSADRGTGADRVGVVFSAALAPTSPLPAFSPAVAGTWHAVGGGAMVFTPATPFRPATEVTLRVPAGSTGVRSAACALLAAPATAVFQAGGWSRLRLEQLLAQLGSLPLTWTPGSGSGVPAQPGSRAVEVSYTQRRSAVGAPPGGVFSWQGNYPSALTSQWRPGQPGEILTGALMAFQADHGLPMTGTATRRFGRGLCWRRGA